MGAEDESPADRPKRYIDCRTIGGSVYLRSTDVQTALKVRAAEYDALRGKTTDPLYATTYAAVSLELTAIAEKHQFADIAHLEQHGTADSVIHTPCTNCGADIEVCPVCGAKQE